MTLSKGKKNILIEETYLCHELLRKKITEPPLIGKISPPSNFTLFTSRG